MQEQQQGIAAPAYQRFQMLKRESSELNANMADACDSVVKLCERLETMARAVKDYTSSAERFIFQPFVDALTKDIPIRVRFMGSKNENAVYVLSGIDSTGLWFKAEDVVNAKEFHISVFSQPEVAGKIIVEPRAMRAIDADGMRAIYGPVESEEDDIKYPQKERRRRRG